MRLAAEHIYMRDASSGSDSAFGNAFYHEFITSNRHVTNFLLVWKMQLLHESWAKDRRRIKENISSGLKTEWSAKINQKDFGEIRNQKIANRTHLRSTIHIGKLYLEMDGSGVCILNYHAYEF